MLTVPVTVASRDRSFSKLKITENYVRTTTDEDDRLGEAATSINYNDFIAEFTARKSRKVDFVCTE
jgi:hypothetical protein